MTAVIRPGSVKLCSLRSPDQARLATTVGADLIGVILAPARRQVTIEQAAEIVAASREIGLPGRPLAVGVFVNAGTGEINAAIARADLDLVQLHGVDDPRQFAELDRPALNVFRPATSDSVAQLLLKFERFAGAETPPLAFVIDGYSEAGEGGTGVRADWHLVAQLTSGWPIVLAGGLTPDNVADAITAASPLVVDVSSGVETSGVKDPAKMRLFVARAKSAFADSKQQTPENVHTKHDGHAAAVAPD